MRLFVALALAEAKRQGVPVPYIFYVDQPSRGALLVLARRAAGIGAALTIERRGDGVHMALTAPAP